MCNNALYVEHLITSSFPSIVHSLSTRVHQCVRTSHHGLWRFCLDLFFCLIDEENMSYFCNIVENIVFVGDPSTRMSHE